MAMDTLFCGAANSENSHGRFDMGDSASRAWLCKIQVVTSMFIAICVIGAAFAETPAKNISQSADQDAILDTIAQINHINWVVNTIKTYKNSVVLEIESQKVSLGNLYLDRISDKAAMERIKQILNTLHDLRMDEREMKRWREDFEERCDRERKTFRLKASKQAVDAMTAQVRECCSLWSWGSNPVGSVAAVVNTAFNVVHSPVSLYNNYDNFVYAQNKAAKDKQFDFDTAKLNLLHQKNMELLEDQWNFITRNKLDDKLRVSDADIRKMLECLRDDNPSRIYTRLVPMSERFSLFPEYWYYLSCVAMETGHFKEGLEACDQFLKVNRHIFRDDPMEGTVAFNKAFMLPKTDANKQEIRRCLELASNNNVLRGDWQLDYLVATLCKGVFDEQEKSEELLERAIATIERESRNRTCSGIRVRAALREGLLKCRNALHELRGEALEPIEDVPEQENVEDFASKLFDQEYGSGLLVLSRGYGGPAYFILFLPIGNIPELNPAFTLHVETLDAGLFSVSRHKRALKEEDRSLWENNNVVVYVFQECSGMAFEQIPVSCSNGEISIFFTGKVDGYSGIQYFSDNVSSVAREIIKRSKIDIDYDKCFSVLKIEKVEVGNSSYTRRSTLKR